MLSRKRAPAATRRHVTRGRFLQSVSIASAPLLIPSRVFGDRNTPGANDRIHIGVIGAGMRGRQLIGDMPTEGTVVALCDCFAPRMQRVIKPDPTSDLAARLQNFTKGDSAGCTMYTDYRKMIDEAHLDAVVVVAPDPAL